MNNIYNFEILAKRIKEERTNAKLSQQELADRLNLAARQTVAKWEKGTAKPQLEDILNMCNIFGCEAGYLLGEYDCRTRIASDISKETGLTEKSISTLKKLVATRSQIPCDTSDTEPALADIILHTVNFLLSYNETYMEYSLLGMISQYLYGDFTHFFTDDIADDENLYYDIDQLGLWDIKHGIENSFNMYKLMDTMLIDIQQKLKETREHILFDCPPLKRLTPIPERTEISDVEYITMLEDELNYIKAEIEKK